MEGPSPAGAGDAERLVVDRSCAIPLSEIEWRFGPSGGPGGQHANRAHTRAEARFDIDASGALTEAQRHRLRERFGPVLAVVVDETRSQSRNRTIALQRMGARLASALVVERPRRATRPSKAATARRLDAKRRRGATKRDRRRPDSHND